MIFWSGRKDSLFSSATGCCTPTGLSPSPERTGWNTTYRFWLWYQHQPCFTCSPQNLPNHRGYFQKGPMDTEYVMPTNKQNKQTKPLKSILNKKNVKKKWKCINRILSYMGARLSGHLNACFLSFDLMDLVIRLGSCTASWYCAIRMLSVTLEARTAMFLCACGIECLPASSILGSPLLWRPYSCLWARPSAFSAKGSQRQAHPWRVRAATEAKRVFCQCLFIFTSTVF